MTDSAVFLHARDAGRETLGASADVDNCMALASRVARLLERARESFEQSGSAIACRAGCTFCCHLRVMVMPHEAIALFRYLGSAMPSALAEKVRARLLERGNERGVGADARLSACAFLVDGMCSAYGVRPSACASFHSLSRERCAENHASAPGAAGATPVLQSLRYVAAELEAGLEQALHDANLSATRVELQGAVADLLRQPSRIARWRSGRDLGRQAQ